MVDASDDPTTTSTREELVGTLGAVLGIEDDRHKCTELLEASDWDLQRAVERGLGVTEERRDGGGSHTVGDEGLRRRHSRRTRGRTENSGPVVVAANARTGRTRGALGNPIRLITSIGFGVFRAAVKLSVQMLDVSMRVFLPRSTYLRFSQPLLSLVGALDRGVRRGSPRALPGTLRVNSESTSETQAREFSEWFSDEFHDGDAASGIHFVQLSHREALRFASRQTKLLLVYLHSPTHQESELFCSQVLTAPEVTSYVNENFVAWGGCVRDGDAHALAEGVNVTSFPYVALLDSTARGGTSLVMSCDGFIDTDGLIAACEEATNRQSGSLDEARVRNAELEAARRLREEQDAAFAESLARDAARAREQEQARQREEEERARLAEEARIAADIKRLEEEAESARRDAIDARRVEKVGKLRSEPGEDEDGVSKLAIRLPDGSRAERRFYSADRISDVYNFVDTLQELDIDSYSLVSNFPRKTFTRDGEDMTLLEAGVHPNGALFVQIEDS